MLVGAFALFALTIAGVGIYGVVSYSASLRTLEFGVRLSFGATPWDIARLVLNEALVILVFGVVLGAPLTYAGLLIIRHQLLGVSLLEPEIYGTAILLLTTCSLVPAWIAARRTKRLSVNDALRHQ